MERSRLGLLVEITTITLGVVLWGSAVTALTMAAGYFLHPAVGVAVALSCIIGTLFVLESNR